MTLEITNMLVLVSLLILQIVTKLTMVGKGQHPMKPHRMRMVHDLIINYEMHRKLDMCVSGCHFLLLAFSITDYYVRLQNLQLGRK